MAEIVIEGLDRLYRKLDTMQDLRDILRPPMHRSIATLKDEVTEYPARPPGSRYNRTLTLGRGWTERVSDTSSGVQGRLGNKVEYAHWVQGARTQARVHRGRWNNTDEAVLARNEQAIVADFEQAIQLALDE